MTTQLIDFDLDRDELRSYCEETRDGRYRAALAVGRIRVRFVGTLDQIDDALEQLQIDSACLRAQEEQEQARRSVA